MSLLALQAGFQAFVRGADDDGRTIAAQLATPPGADAGRRMGVYRHAYRARMGQVLREVFDKTWSYLGDEAFERAVDDYVGRHVSNSSSLDDYGARFPDSLANLWPAERDVAELAWLDWSMRRVFDGADAIPVDGGVLETLRGDAWDRISFDIHPTLAMRAVTTNVGALWSSLDEGAPRMPAPLESPLAVRVWRKDLQPHFRTIDLVEAGALAQLSQGRRFADVCERLGQDPFDAPVERAALMLATWLQDGLIVGLRNA